MSKPDHARQVSDFDLSHPDSFHVNGNGNGSVK